MDDPWPQMCETAGASLKGRRSAPVWDRLTRMAQAGGDGADDEILVFHASSCIIGAAGGAAAWDSCTVALISGVETVILERAA